ncbi:hypothetical protein EXIGLDRAFT_831281 [Exidia glandulosa HHB12029]|uniref:F-box domain-containing protein n=1 Tax=Exidia glandulosa HHB12029 TaxID=1314781 RepID=A0A165MTQ4_EXIGL|nr:hypothetical protein EXIGLDRAFT_831281 [Exidia glandulosa HHB12029]
MLDSHILPPEIWCMVWQDMSFDDRVSATHVSRYWRHVARSCPRLWTHLQFYSTVHHVECECAICGPYELDTRAIWKQPGKTNYQLVLNALPLSGSLPVHLDVHVSPFYSDHGLLEDFGMDIQNSDSGAADRLASLQVVFDDPDTLMWLLSGLGSLPSLTSLITRAVTSEAIRFSHVRAWRNNAIHLPSLRTLVLDNMRWQCPDRQWPIHLPSLEYLTCPLTDPDEVVRVLDACPALKTLLIVVPSEDQDEHFEPDWMLDGPTLARLARIPSVHVIGVSDFETEKWAIRNFGSIPDRPDFVLHYLPNAVPLHSNRLLAEMRDITAFSLTRAYNSSVTVLAIQNSQGIRRRILFGPAHLGNLCPTRIIFGPNSTQLTTLHLSAPFAFLITDRLPHLTSLVVEIVAETDLAAFKVPMNTLVPALQSLCIVNIGPTYRLGVRAEVLAAVLVSLCGVVALKEVTLKGVALYGDMRFLQGRVQRMIF